MAVVVIFRAPLSFRINFSNSYKNPHFMLLSDSINAMYNAGGVFEVPNIDNDLDKIRVISDSKQQSLFYLFRIVSCKLICDDLFDMEVERLCNIPLVVSPVRYLNDKMIFVEFVRQVIYLSFKWEQSFNVVADIYYKCFGSNLFYKDGMMFKEFGDDYFKFKKYKENHKL